MLPSRRTKQGISLRQLPRRILIKQKSTTQQLKKNSTSSEHHHQSLSTKETARIATPRKQNKRRHSKKERRRRKLALTASRDSRTRYSQQNNRHHRGSAEQKLPPRRDQCQSPPHLGDHHQEGHQGGARPTEGEQAALRIGPQPRDQPQEGAHREKQAEGAHPVRNTGTLPPAEQGLLNAQRTSTTATDNHRSIRHRTAPHQQEGEPTFTPPARTATRWSKRRK